MRNKYLEEEILCIVKIACKNDHLFKNETVFCCKMGTFLKKICYRPKRVRK